MIARAPAAAYPARRPFLRARGLALAALALAAALPARAQVPEKFTNLKFFPKDIARADLVEAMRGFSFALGVRCEHCHAGAGGPDLKLDFASDEKEPKKTARIMLEMVRAINADHIGKLGGAAVRVECYTCHHGVKTPKRIETVLYDVVEEKGLPAALAELDALRGRYYGSGAYDFGETAFCRFGERLMRSGRLPEAITVLEMNVARNPDGDWARQLLGDAYRDHGEFAKARAAYEALARKEPDNAFYRSRLEDLAKREAAAR
jgi:tetratricopeptide (TPR) repeat protein